MTRGSFYLFFRTARILRRRVSRPRQEKARRENSSSLISRTADSVRSSILFSKKQEIGVIRGLLLCGQAIWQVSHPHTVLLFRINSISEFDSAPFLCVISDRHSPRPESLPVGHAALHAPHPSHFKIGFGIIAPTASGVRVVNISPMNT